MRSDTEFWRALDALIASSEIVIDRPRGSRHPRCTHIVYPLDYGYLANTTSTDGEGVDVWLGSSESHALRAILVSVDLDKRDSEIKLLLGLSTEETALIYDFYNSYEDMKALLIERGEET